MTPLGMEPPTCRLVAQCLNQLRQRSPRKKRAVKKGGGERNLKERTKEKENKHGK